MDFVIEVILLIILLGGSYAGIRFGFIQIAAKPIKVIASLSFALLLCRGVGMAVIAPIIQVPVSSYIKDFVYSNCSDVSFDNVSAEIPTLLKMAGAVFNVDMSVRDSLSGE